MDAARREQLETILSQDASRTFDQHVHPSDAVCPEDAQDCIKANEQLSMIDSIAFEAISTPVTLNQPHGLQYSPCESKSMEPDGVDTTVGRQIGPYLVAEQIDQGGVDTTFRARRIDDSDSTQQVAIKLIRCGMNNNVVLRRFETEFRVQAALDKHPNISAFLEAGATEDGQLFLVREHINGLPINAYCDKNRLTIPARLYLFIQVCEAVQFAHRHALIHRNLRPSNILIKADGTPQLIDFGFAALVQAEISGANGYIKARAPLSGAVEVALTPEYASPEQVEGEIVTTASDVYALGIVLYELLSGCWPYRLMNFGRAEIFQAICEQAAEKPSTAVHRRLANRLGTANYQSAPLTTIHVPEPRTEPLPVSALHSMLTADEIAEDRGLSAVQLKRFLAGDLDTIVLTAIRKEPEWRYP